MVNEGKYSGNNKEGDDGIFLEAERRDGINGAEKEADAVERCYEGAKVGSNYP